MKKAASALLVYVALCFAIAALAGCAVGERGAVQAQGTDVLSTVTGLSLGAVEANPLGLSLIGAKVIAHRHIKSQPAIEQPALWAVFGAFGWAAAANNACVVAAIVTGGAGVAVCPLIGVTTGIGVWGSSKEATQRATFDVICADAQARNPGMVCIYNGS